MAGESYPSLIALLRIYARLLLRSWEKENWASLWATAAGVWTFLTCELLVDTLEQYSECIRLSTEYESVFETPWLIYFYNVVLNSQSPCD